MSDTEWNRIHLIQSSNVVAEQVPIPRTELLVRAGSIIMIMLRQKKVAIEGGVHGNCKYFFK